MSDKQIDPRHRDLADQLCLAAVDGDDVAFFDSLAEVVDAGIRAAVSVCGLLARQLAEATRLLDTQAGDATAEEDDE